MLGINKQLLFLCYEPVTMCAFLDQSSCIYAIDDQTLSTMLATPFPFLSLPVSPSGSLPSKINVWTMSSYQVWLPPSHPSIPPVPISRLSFVACPRVGTTCIAPLPFTRTRHSLPAGWLQGSASPGARPARTDGQGPSCSLWVGCAWGWGLTGPRDVERPCWWRGRGRGKAVPAPRFENHTRPAGYRCASAQQRRRAQNRGRRRRRRALVKYSFRPEGAAARSPTPQSSTTASRKGTAERRTPAAAPALRARGRFRLPPEGGGSPHGHASGRRHPTRWRD
jgi:hypothetical protein